jgi:hypothetical protein
MMHLVQLVTSIDTLSLVKGHSLHKGSLCVMYSKNFGKHIMICVYPYSSQRRVLLPKNALCSPLTPPFSLTPGSHQSFYCFHHFPFCLFQDVTWLDSYSVCSILGWPLSLSNMHSHSAPPTPHPRLSLWLASSLVFNLTLGPFDKEQRTLETGPRGFLGAGSTD